MEKGKAEIGGRPMKPWDRLLTEWKWDKISRLIAALIIPASLIMLAAGVYARSGWLGVVAMVIAFVLAGFYWIAKGFGL